MRVLVTRPARSGARTAIKLEAGGHEPLLMPLTAAVYDIDATRAALDASTGAIAVTSAEAIRSLRAVGASLAAHLRRPFFAVGRATAEKAVETGFATVCHSNGDGAELADLVAKQRPLLGSQPLTYLAGSPRASGFETGLAMQEISFNSVECYRMDAVQPSEAELQHALGDRPVDAVLFYSRHSGERFFSLDSIALHMDRLKNTRLLCLSATIATIVPYALQSQVEIAAAPDEDSLLALLDADARANLI